MKHTVIPPNKARDFRIYFFFAYAPGNLLCMLARLRLQHADVTTSHESN